MKKVFLFLNTLVLLLTVCGCAGIKYIAITTYEPAQLTLSPNILSVVVTNNVVQQPDNVGHNTISIRESQKERAEASSDSVAIYYTEALAQFLGEEEYFNNVFYYNSPLRYDADFFQEQPILPETMNKIRRETGTDAIISLDKLIIETEKKEQFRQQGYAYCNLTGKISSILRVYMPTMEGKIPTIQYDDSLNWEGFDIQDENAYADVMIPSREEAMKMLAVRAAEKMTNVLIPHWQQQDRWYYTMVNSLMREGETFAKEAKWDNAIKKWEAYYNGRSHNIDKAKAANNIALGYEMLDNIEEAYNWATKANDLFVKHTGSNSMESRRSSIYKNELKRRLDQYKPETNNISLNIE